MSNNNDQRRAGQQTHSQGSTEVPSKKDVAAESGKVEAQQLKNEAAGSGRRVKETAKEQAVAAKDEAMGQAHDLWGRLKEDLQGYVGPQQERLASTVRSVSDEVDAISQGKKPETEYVSGLLGNASGTVNSLASSLENKDPQQLLGDVRRFAARRPGTFLAIAAGIGLLAGRATRSAKDSDEIGNDHHDTVARTQAPAYGTPSTGDAYAYRNDTHGEGTRTYTDRVPGTVYPDQRDAQVSGTTYPGQGDTQVPGTTYPGQGSERR